MDSFSYPCCSVVYDIESKDLSLKLYIFCMQDKDGQATIIAQRSICKGEEVGLYLIPMPKRPITFN